TWPLELSLGLLAAVLAWLAWRRWYRRREAIRLLTRSSTTGGITTSLPRLRGFSGVRTIVSAGIILAIAVSAGVAASALAPPSGPRLVARSAIVQPFDPLAYPSPLSGFRSYEKPPAVNDTMLTVTGLPSNGRIRIATLDSYNGVVYSVGSGQPDALSGSFTRVPYAFDQSAVRGKQVSLQVEIGRYSGVWVPTLGKLESIDFSGSRAESLRDSFYYNDNSGTAAVVRPLAKGDRYTLTAVQPVQPSLAQLSTLMPGSARVPAIGVVPDDLLTTLNGYVGDASGAGQRLVAMITGLKENGYISHGVSPNAPFSRSGHAADRITQLLTDQRMIGDQEQYAVTAALMARQLGFPARVVFGFAPTSVAAEGATTIRGSDISAWIEVDTTQFGWVTVDPNPPVRSIPEEKPKDPTQVARPQSPVQPPAQPPLNHATQTPPDSTQDNPANPNALLEIIFAILRIGGWMLLVAAVLLSPFLTIVAAKRRRSVLRRRAPLAVDRMSGGWQEFEDAVIDHGYLTSPSSTRSEIAAVVGGMQPLVLASVADRAVFSPSTPNDADVEALWGSVQELRVSLDASLTRWQRIKALVSVRSLGGYSVKKLFKR
ncbi:MAG: transglutaminase-like domain-containing protein, partial [Lacisediminihabitans sp.]